MSRWMSQLGTPSSCSGAEHAQFGMVFESELVDQAVDEVGRGKGIEAVDIPAASPEHGPYRYRLGDPADDVAVYLEGMPVDVAGGVGAQPDDERGDLVRGQEVRILNQLLLHADDPRDHGRADER